MLAAYALTEAGSGSDSAAMRTTARRDGDEYVLDGSKRFITNASVAGLYTVFAKTDPDAGHAGISAFVVEAGTPGLRGRAARAEDGDLRLHDRRAHFRRRARARANMLGEEGEGFRIAMRILDRSRPGVAAQGLGIAQGATDYALEYARTRETMGRPIAEHQLIAGKLADMETRCEAARGLLYRFGRMVDEGADDAELTKASAMAKLYCSDTAMDVTTEAVQILGGYGYIREYPVERMMRDAKITQIYEGTQRDPAPRDRARDAQRVARVPARRRSPSQARAGPGAAPLSPCRRASSTFPQWTSAFRQSFTSFLSAPGFQAFRKSACALNWPLEEREKPSPPRVG